MKQFDTLLLGENKTQMQALIQALKKTKSNQNELNTELANQQALIIKNKNQEYQFNIITQQIQQEQQYKLNINSQSLVIICYKINSLDAIQQIEKRLDLVYETRKVVQIVLIGIKSELEEKEGGNQTILELKFQNFQKYKIAISETNNVKKMFLRILNDFIDQNTISINSELEQNRENKQQNINNQKKSINEKKKRSNPSWFLCCQE